MLPSFKTLLTLPFLLALLSTEAARSGEPMDGASFDAYTRGKTLFYGQNGKAHGAEIYMDDRRVKWSSPDGQCKDGFWYEEAGQICFVYEDNQPPLCWAFSKRDGMLIARFQNLPGATEVQGTQRIDEEIICLAPNLGV